MVRPYVFAASSRAARNLFLLQAQPTRPFVSAVLFNRARTSCTKLQAHSNSKNSVGEEYSCGNSLGFWFVPVSGRRFSARATNVNDAGSIDSPLMHSMEKKVCNFLINDINFWFWLLGFVLLLFLIPGNGKKLTSFAYFSFAMIVELFESDGVMFWLCFFFCWVFDIWCQFLRIRV